MNLFEKSFLSLALACLTMPTFASADIIEDFSSGVLPATLESTYLASGNPPAGGGIFDGSSVIVGGTGDDGRAYFGTVQADFGTLDFTAEIDVTVGADSDTNSFTSFFGLGAGVGGGTGSAGGFDEPTAGADDNSIFMGVRGTVNYLAFDEGDVQLSGLRSADGVSPGAGAGTHRVRMVHDVTAGTLSYFIDIGKTGTFTALPVSSTQATFDTSNNGFTTTNSQIFFGGSEGRVFDNLSVVTAVPEPTTLGVLGLLGLGFCTRRRRS